MDLTTYANQCLQPYAFFTPKLLNKYLDNNKYKRLNILEIGCGDGALVYSINKKYNFNITGIDISEVRINRAKKAIPDSNFFVCDIINNKGKMNELKKIKWDLIILNQVIEHIPVNKINTFLGSIKTLMNKETIFYISSVLREKIAVHFYINKGKKVIDPTHEFEFSSTIEFINMLKINNFKIIKNNKQQFTLPLGMLIDKIFRLFFSKTKKVLPDILYNLRIPVIGYKYIDGICSS